MTLTENGKVTYLAGACLPEGRGAAQGGGLLPQPEALESLGLGAWASLGASLGAWSQGAAQEGMHREGAHLPGQNPR